MTSSFRPGSALVTPTAKKLHWICIHLKIRVSELSERAPQEGSKACTAACGQALAYFATALNKGKWEKGFTENVTTVFERSKKVMNFRCGTQNTHLFFINVLCRREAISNCKGPRAPECHIGLWDPL